MANPDLVANVIAGSSDRTLRKLGGGDMFVLARLVAQLCESPKDRSADLLASIIHACPHLAAVRAEMAASSIPERIAAAVDPSRDFYERAVAAWFASGIEWGRERNVGAGDVIALGNALHERGVSERWCHAVRRALIVAPEPLFVMLLPLWTETGGSRNVVTRTAEVPRYVLCSGDVPTFALDKHTRIGNAAILRFARENADIRSVIGRSDPLRMARALGIAAFYTDGSPISLRLDWPRGEEIEARGITSDLLAAKLSPDQIELLRAAFASNLDHLNAIRVELASEAAAAKGLEYLG